MGTQGSRILSLLPALFVHLLLLLGWQLVWHTAREEEPVEVRHAKGPPQHCETIALGESTVSLLHCLPRAQSSVLALPSALPVHVSGMVMPLERIHRKEEGEF